MHAYLMRARMEFRSRVFSSVLPYVSTNFRKNTEESVRLAALKFTNVIFSIFLHVIIRNRK